MRLYTSRWRVFFSYNKIKLLKACQLGQRVVIEGKPELNALDRPALHFGINTKLHCLELTEMLSPSPSFRFRQIYLSKHNTYLLHYYRFESSSHGTDAANMTAAPASHSEAWSFVTIKLSQVQHDNVVELARAVAWWNFPRLSNAERKVRFARIMWSHNSAQVLLNCVLQELLF